jgi:hypothetical protein
MFEGNIQAGKKSRYLRVLEVVAITAITKTKETQLLMC